MKKMILTTLLIASAYTHANEDINYNYLELGYGYLDLNNSINANGFYLDGSFDLSEHFYLGGHYENRSYKGVDFDRYDLTLGFHTNGSGSTDFYTDFRFGDFKFDNVDGTSASLFFGTRSILTKRIELISKLGVNHVYDIEHPDGDSVNLYEAEVKGLFKFNDSQAISASLESLDGKFGARIGYRHSF